MNKMIYLLISQKSGRAHIKTRVFSHPRFHRSPHAQLPHFILPKETCRYTLVRYFARHRSSFDRVCATEDVRGLLPQTGKGENKGPLYQHTIGTVHLNSRPSSTTTCRFCVPLVCVSANNVYARVLWYAGCKARTRLRPP